MYRGWWLRGVAQMWIASAQMWIASAKGAAGAQVGEPWAAGEGAKAGSSQHAARPVPVRRRRHRQDDADGPAGQLCAPTLQGRFPCPDQVQGLAPSVNTPTPHSGLHVCCVVGPRTRRAGAPVAVMRHTIQPNCCSFRSPRGGQLETMCLSNPWTAHYRPLPPDPISLMPRLLTHTCMPYGPATACGMHLAASFPCGQSACTGDDAQGFTNVGI